MTTVDADTVAVLAAGLDWIYHVEQPDGAIPCHHGYGTRLGDRRIRFVGQGYRGLPVVVVDVAEPVYEGPPHRRRLTNPLDGYAEAERFSAAIIGLGYDVESRWNWMGETGSLGLTRPAHPSLLAGLARYTAQCPTHRTVFCGGWMAPREDQKDCTWLRDGAALVIEPTWPAPATAEEAPV